LCSSLDAKSNYAKAEYFTDQNGVIYRRSRNKEPQLVVPKSLVKEIISLNHNPNFVAHPGRKRTMNVVSLRCWWIGMQRDIDRYVQECDFCRKRKNRRLFRAPMGKVHHPTYPFQYTHMDVTGPFLRSTSENKYVLNFIDEPTKIMEAIPLAEISAQNCARAYATDIVARHGSSTYLITDRRSNFTSVFFNETCRILGVKHLNTSAYHPQANGAIERIHSTMCRSISHYINPSDSKTGTL
jgi:transposase InsO family protein